MKRFKNILVVAHPTENAGAAVQRALELAERQSARLTFVDVIPEMPPDLQELGLVSDDVWSDLTAEREARMRALVASDQKLGAIDFKLLVGTPFIQIVGEVISGDHDLLIKPAGGARVGLFGSTDMHLLRKCPCPVWIVKPTKRKKYQHIMAAVDPDPREPNAQLNTLILDLATSLARREEAELHVVSAWEVWAEPTLRMRSHQADLDSVLDGVRKANNRWLKELTAPYLERAAKFQTHLLKGKPNAVIPKEAKKRKIDLIVMGTVGRVGIPGFFIGNTAERILSEVECSVLAVKPPGFQSPVEP